MLREPRRLADSLAALSLAALCFLVTAVSSTGSAQARPIGQVTTAVTAQPSGRVTAEAVDAAASVAQFRSRMNVLINDYLNRYAARLTPAERAQMGALARKADADLGRLERTTKATPRQLKAGAHRAAAASARRGLLEFERSYAEATQTLTQLQPILQPHLGIFEAIEAKSTVDQELATFRQIGEQLSDVCEELNPR